MKKDENLNATRQEKMAEPNEKIDSTGSVRKKTTDDDLSQSEKRPDGVKDKAFEFSDLGNPADPSSSTNIEFILDIPLEITVELGRTDMLIDQLLKLGQGSVIELSKRGGDTLDILANQKLIARGDVVIVNEKYGIRLTEIVSPMERVEKLG